MEVAPWFHCILSVLPTCRPYECWNFVKFKELGPWLGLQNKEGASVLAFGDSGLSVLSRCFCGGHKPTGTGEFCMKHFFYRHVFNSYNRYGGCAHVWGSAYTYKYLANLRRSWQAEIIHRYGPLNFIAVFFVQNVKNSCGNHMESGVDCSFLVVFILLISANLVS